jgi:hypothetical protein
MSLTNLDIKPKWYVDAWNKTCLIDDRCDICRQRFDGIVGMRIIRNPHTRKGWNVCGSAECEKQCKIWLDYYYYNNNFILLGMFKSFESLGERRYNFVLPNSHGGLSRFIIFDPYFMLVEKILHVVCTYSSNEKWKTVEIPLSDMLSYNKSLNVPFEPIYEGIKFDQLKHAIDKERKIYEDKI